MSVDLRSYVFLDSLQPQHAAFSGPVAKGFMPLPFDASLWIETSPGIEINRITEIALKATTVRPGMQIVERRYGLLEVHSDSQADTRAAGAAILEALGLREQDRMKPRVLSSQIIRNIDRYEIDFRICMYCGLCTEACPYEAIQPGGPLNDATYRFDDMYRDKHALTRVAAKHLESHDNTYPNGRKAPAPDADFHRL